MIYFFKFQDYVKIGYSINPIKRVSAIQVDLPEKIEVLGIIKGDRKLEKHLHDVFMSHRSSGEWFTYCNEIQDFIDEQENFMWEFGLDDKHPLTTNTVKRARLNSGLTYEQIGKVLGVSTRAVPKMENRAKNESISLKKLRSLSEALGYDLEYRFKPKK